MKLKQGLQQHFEQQQLDDSQLQQLLSLQSSSAQAEQAATAQPGDSSLHHPSRWSQYRLVAASLLLCLLMSGLFIHQSAPTRLYQSIADEVANNHLKLKPLEISSSDISTVSTYFDQLNFIPRASRNRALAGLLLGGRYCSIDGEPAAQLRYKRDDGMLRSLYQVPTESDYRDLPDILQGQMPLRLYSQGFTVDLWREQGLLMAAVTLAPDNQASTAQ